MVRSSLRSAARPSDGTHYCTHPKRNIGYNDWAMRSMVSPQNSVRFGRSRVFFQMQFVEAAGRKGSSAMPVVVVHFRTSFSGIQVASSSCFEAALDFLKQAVSCLALVASIFDSGWGGGGLFSLLRQVRDPLRVRGLFIQKSLDLHLRLKSWRSDFESAI